MVRTRLCAALAAVLIALAAPVAGSAAPEGKVIIAQGVDPSTLDAMNQQETPASVVATGMRQIRSARGDLAGVIEHRALEEAVGHDAPLRLQQQTVAVAEAKTGEPA